MYLDFYTMNNGDIKETFVQDDFILDVNDETLFDLDLISIVKDIKKLIKGFNKTMNNLFKS